MAKETKNEKNNTKIVLGVGAGVATGAAILYWLLKENNTIQLETNSEYNTSFEYKAENKVQTKPKKTNTVVTAQNSTTKTPTTIKPAVTKISDSEAKEIAKNLDKAVYMMQHTSRIVEKKKQQMYDASVLMRDNVLKLKSTIDYINANNHFVRIGILRVNKSIITQVFETWGFAPGMRKLITDHFLKIGLKQNPDGKWSTY